MGQMSKRLPAGKILELRDLIMVLRLAADEPENRPNKLLIRELADDLEGCAARCAANLTRWKGE